MKASEALLWSALVATNAAWAAYAFTRGGGAEPAPDAADPSAAPARDVAKRLQGWKEDVLQIEDAKRREVGLDAVEAALRSTDPTTAAGALRGLYDLRDVPYDKRRFRDAVLVRLDDGDAAVRQAAAFALMQVPHEDGDVDRLLDSIEAHPDGASRSLVVAANSMVGDDVRRAATEAADTLDRRH